MRHVYARLLATAYLAGEWERSGLLTRGTELLGASGRWQRVLVHDVLVRYTSAPRDRRDELARFIAAAPPFEEAWRRRQIRRIHHVLTDTPVMAPARWNVRPLHTLRDVADWLGVTDGELAWFADRRGMERRADDERLRHYVYRWIPKQSGGARLLEAPKARLKSLQRRVLEDVLDAIPPHEACHGFRKGRSVLTHARLHVGQPVVLRFDLRAFFTDVSPARAYGVFRTAGYPEEVARTLIALCTNRVPHAVLRDAPRPRTSDEVQAHFHASKQLADFHLPQGAPTSPALANLCAYGLDVRLTGLARALGATYSRYADDLTFSGGADLGSGPGRLEELVQEIALSEGFALNRRKTRVLPQSRRQAVTGVVVNARVNIARDEVDRLKAILHNCVNDGPSRHSRGTPCFRDHLLGRVRWVESLNPARGAKLLRAFEAIDWSR